MAFVQRQRDRHNKSMFSGQCVGYNEFTACGKGDAMTTFGEFRQRRTNICPGSCKRDEWETQTGENADSHHIRWGAVQPVQQKEQEIGSQRDLGQKRGGGSSQPCDFAYMTYLSPCFLTGKRRLVRLTSGSSVDYTV